MLFDTYTPQMAEVHIKVIMQLLKEGTPREHISKHLNLRDIEELISIAKARLTSKKTAKEYYMMEEDLRFATNEVVAEYRAKRLACNTLVDIGCGIGIQTLAFAKTCKRVIAVDIDPRKVRYALENAKKHDINNVEFIHGDGLTVLETLKKADAIFVDPERAPEEDVRDIAKSFKPNLLTLIKTASKVTPDIAIELPPQIREVPFDCEREYTSFNHELNRLTVYLGGLKKSDRSAVILPGHHVLQSGKEGALQHSGPLSYIYEVDPAVAKAGLTGSLADGKTFLYSDERDILLTTDTLRTSPYFKARYELIEAVPNKFEKIMEVLKWENAGSVVLRAKIDPRAYWAERKQYEKHLKGAQCYHVFLFKDEALICKKLPVSELC